MKKRYIIMLCLLALALGLAVGAQAETTVTPELTVNGSATGVSVAFNEEVTVRIIAPNATGVKLEAERPAGTYGERQYWCDIYDRWNIAPIIEESGKKMYDRGTWTITAAYTTDNYDDDTDLREAEDINWIPIGSGVTVQVSNFNARMNEPAAELSPSTGSVARGEMVTITMSSFQNVGEWYWIDLEKQNGNDWDYIEHINMNVASGAGNTFGLSTLGLESGYYKAWVRCEAVNYEDNGKELYFTVTNPTSLPDMSLQLSATNAQTSRDIMIYSWAPEADWVDCDITKSDDPNWRDGRGGGGGYQSWSWSSSDAGSYTITLKAWQGDDTLLGTRTATLNVTAPKGSLQAPSLSNVPGVMPMGTAVNGSFSAVQNAEEYHVELKYYPWGGGEEMVFRSQRRATDANATALSFPGWLFQRMGRYQLMVHANSPGWNGGHLDHQIMVTEPMDEVLTLKVNGSTEDITGWPSLRDFRVDVACPDNVTALRLLNEDDWEFFDAQDFHGVTWSKGSGNYTMMALATAAEPVWRDDDFNWDDFNWDDLEWTMISNSVQVNVTAPNGDLANPTLTMADSVNRGAWLSATIGSVNNAQRYHLRMYHRNGDGYEDDCLFDEVYAEPGAVKLPTAPLTVGEEYCVRVWADAEGWNSGESPEKRFTVTAGASGDSFMVSATQARTQEPIAFSICAPGADVVRLTVDSQLWNEEWGDALMGTIDFDVPGTHEVRAIAPDGNDGWRLIGEAITIQVTAPNGSLAAAIDAPASISTNEQKTFTVTWQTGGIPCHFEVTLNTGDWEDVPLETVSIDEVDGVVTGTYRIDGADLNPGDVYRIETWIRPYTPGYLPTQRICDIMAKQGQPRGTVTVVDDELLRCESTRVTVDVPGATALWVYHGEGGWDGFIGSHVEQEWDFFGVGTNLIYARYTTQPINNPQSVDFATLNWEGCTPTATVEVKSLGRLDSPVFTLENEVVKQGQPFRITIGALQGKDEWYLASLQDDNYNNVTDNFFWDEDTRTVTVDTFDVEPGLYWLELHGDAVGYESCDARRYVAVEEADAGLTVSLPDQLLTQDRPRVGAIAPGALSITMEISYPGSDRKPRTITQQGEHFSENVVFSDTACTAHVKFTATYVDDVTETFEKDIRIVAPYGERPNPTLCMPGRWMEGQPLSFRVDAGRALFIYTEIRDRRTGTIVYEDEDIRFDDWFYNIPASVFQAGHMYEINVWSTEVGYNANETIYIVAPLPQDPDTLTLPASLTTVDTEAFAGISAQVVAIPGTVRAVASRAFANCNNLMAVEIANGVSGIDQNAFADSGAFMVYGQAGSTAEAYANGNSFATFIRLE